MVETSGESHRLAEVLAGKGVMPLTIGGREQRRRDLLRTPAIRLRFP